MLLKPANRHRIFPHSPWRPGKARNGKIARLPDKLRESTNLLLSDGLTYEAIIAKLGEDGKHLNYHNLKRWRQGGYQDWRREQQRNEVQKRLAANLSAFTGLRALKSPESILTKPDQTRPILSIPDQK